MQLANGIEEKDGDFICRIVHWKSTEMGSLGVTINDDHYYGEPMGGGKARDKIQCQIFPNVDQNGQGLKQTGGFPCFIFCLLTDWTLSHESTNVCLDNGPIEVLAQAMKCLGHAGMAPNG